MTVRPHLRLGFATLLLVSAGCWDWTRPEHLMHEDARATPDGVATDFATDFVLDTGDGRDAAAGDGREDVVRDDLATDAPADTKPLADGAPPDAPLPDGPAPDKPAWDLPQPDGAPDLPTHDLPVTPDLAVDSSVDSGPCPPICNSGCAGGVCMIVSSVDKLSCPKGMPCKVYCGDGLCTKGVDCSSATSCTIECIGTNACRTGVVKCGTGMCNVTCQGKDACRTGGVDCTMSCGCSVLCSGTGACNTPPKCPAKCGTKCGPTDGCSC
jgi:hypothetical protein